MPQISFFIGWDKIRFGQQEDKKRVLKSANISFHGCCKNTIRRPTGYRVSHWFLEIAGGQAIRPAVFSIPRVNEFMRNQCGVSEVRREVRKVVFSCPVFARFVVLDAEVRKLIAKGQQEVILAVVCCAEQSSCFANYPPIFFDEPRRRVQSFVYPIIEFIRCSINSTRCFKPALRVQMNRLFTQLY